MKDQYQRDTQCSRCHGWYDRRDLVSLIDGLLCVGCHDAFSVEDEDDLGQEYPEPEGGSYEPSSLKAQTFDLPEALLQRRNAGFDIRVNRGELVVTSAWSQERAPLDDSEVWDAFQHPALYLHSDACARLQLR